MVRSTLKKGEDVADMALVYTHPGRTTCIQPIDVVLAAESVYFPVLDNLHVYMVLHQMCRSYSNDFGLWTQSKVVAPPTFQTHATFGIVLALQKSHLAMCVNLSRLTSICLSPLGKNI